MIGWHHRLDGHEFEQALGVGDGQGSLACWSPWGRKQSDSTEQLSWTEDCGCLLWSNSPHGAPQQPANRARPQTQATLCNVSGCALVPCSHRFVVFQLLSHVSLQLHDLQHTKLSCPSPSSRVCSNSYQLSQWCHPTISSSVIPFSSHLHSFPASGSFPVSQLFTSGAQRFGASASASIIPLNIQGWFHLGLLVWSPCCPRDSQEFSPASPFKSINSLALSLLYGPTLTSIRDYWKNRSFDNVDFCQQSGVSAF